MVLMIITRDSETRIKRSKFQTEGESIAKNSVPK